MLLRISILLGFSSLARSNHRGARREDQEGDKPTVYFLDVSVTWILWRDDVQVLSSSNKQGQYIREYVM